MANSSKRLTRTRRVWVAVTWGFTWWIPSFCLRICCKMNSEAVRMAWREKVTLNILILLTCGVLLFYIIGLGQILCPKTNILSQGEIDGKKSLSNPFVSMYGHYYKITDIVKTHVNDQAYVNSDAMEQSTLGRDVSAMFFKTDFFRTYCPTLTPPPSGWDNIRRVIPENAITVWNFHRGKDSRGRPINYVEDMKYARRGAIARDMDWIKQYLADDPERNYIVVAYGKVYDVSQYFDPVLRTGFLGDNMKQIFISQGKSGKDATMYFERVKKAEGPQKWKAYLDCMDQMFFIGVMDYRQSAQCQFSNYMMLTSSIILVMIIGFKFLAALQFSPRSNPEDQDKYVLCVVPTYTEGAESIRATLDSIALSKYRDDRRIAFIISDGMIIGSGNDRPTPEILLQVLGTERSEESDTPHVYLALGEGERRLNRAAVYSGIYTVQGREMPYIVVVKTGREKETERAGNRGKRDSQIIIMRFLSRFLAQKPFDPLDIQIYQQFQKLGIPIAALEYLLWVDADTDIFPDGINRFVAAMAGDTAITGICGETLLKNEEAGWVTAIQVYEYFISHHLAKSFESLFGSVTCLPGCWSMYRIQNPETGAAYLASQGIIRDYGQNNVDTLHLKNLLSLGEDRYLTTLMLKHFPQNKLKFIAEAKAKTSAPDKWSVLVSQRRRWINSTVHNLLELVQLNNLCGFCFFSMRFVIFLDLFATVVQPAGFVYVVYLITSIFLGEEKTVPFISLVMIGAIYGLQVVIFVLKQEWQHIGWMFVYILAMPVYAFYLPLYSFWHFDDFTWGNTRMIANGNESLDSLGKRDLENFDSQNEENLEALVEMKPLSTVISSTSIPPRT